MVPSGWMEDLFLPFQVLFFVVLSPRTSYDLVLLGDRSNDDIYILDVLICC